MKYDTINRLAWIDDIDLFVLPCYLSDLDNVEVRAFEEYLANPEDMAKIVSPHRLGELAEFPMDNEETLLAVYLDDTDSPYALDTVLDQVFFYIEDKGVQNAAIAQLGFVKHGLRDQNEWAKHQAYRMQRFIDSHKGADLTMIVPAYNEIPPKEYVKSREAVPHEGTHYTVHIEPSEVKTYRDYLATYIQKRMDSHCIIRVKDESLPTDNIGIQSLGDMLEALCFYEGRGDKKENISKWGIKTAKKNGGWYCPVPSKEKLKLIILLLDMNYEEAADCLFFFGYGLAACNDEDKFFKEVLLDDEKWRKPVDVAAVDRALVKEFGECAALRVDHGKGAPCKF